MKQILAAGGLCLFVCFIAAPAFAAENMIQMEESPSPPKGVKQLAAEMKKAEGQKKASAPSQASAGSNQKAPKPKKEKSGAEKKTNYHGVFDVFTPAAPVFPIKSGNIKTSYIGLANNTGKPAGNSLRNNVSSGYFIEGGGVDYGQLKNVTGKVQYNKQLRN